MSKNLFNSTEGQRGTATVTIPMHELYELIRERVAHVQADIDPDALVQRICVEVEKHQGTFPNVEGRTPAKAAISPWMPEQDRLRLAILGKLSEELAEASQRVARCIIHGIHEKDPDNGLTNEENLRAELTDVEVCMAIARDHFHGLRTMIGRYRVKYRGFQQWHDMIAENEPEKD